MRLAAVQYRPPKGEPEKARSELVERVREAGEVDLVVCPEMATSGYVWRSPQELLPHAEAADGPTFQALSERAREQGCWIVCGFPELAPEGLYNSALVIDDKGQLACCYRKVLLYEADLAWARMGRARPVLQTPFGRLVPGICMDLNDDNFALHLHRSKPDVVAFCTNWIDQGHDILPYWRWRMFGWRGWFVAADCWGEDSGTSFYGRSAILAPGGEPAQMAPARGDCVLVHDTEVAV